MVRRPLAFIAVAVAAGAPWLSAGDVEASPDPVDPSPLLVVAVLALMCQIVSGLFLVAGVRAKDSRARTVVSWYYAIAAGVAGFSIVVAMSGRGVHVVITVLAAVGVVCFSGTAVCVLRGWLRLGEARSDAAMFVGAGHMLVLLGTVGSLLVATGEPLDDFALQVLGGAVLGATVLALPASAGLWLRLLVMLDPQPVRRRRRGSWIPRGMAAFPLSVFAVVFRSDGA